MGLLGNASIVRVARTATPGAPGPYVLIESQAVLAGYCLAITDVQFSVNTLPDTFFMSSPFDITGANDIAAWQCQEEVVVAPSPFSYERHYRTPIVIDALAGATTWGMIVLAGAAPAPAYASVIGELWDYRHHTARKYGYNTFNAGEGSTPVNLGTAYTVPTGYKLSITDIDVSAIAAGAADAPYIFQLLVGGTVAYYLELMAPGIKFASIECPIEATSGQVVQMQGFCKAGAPVAPDLMKAQWTGQLI